jgi:hypothetical protein
LPSLEAITKIDDRVNMLVTLAAAAWIAAARGDEYRAGILWGAIEAAEERQPNPAWTKQREQYHERVAVVSGAEFERGRVRGRTLSQTEALDVVRASVD